MSIYLAAALLLAACAVVGQAVLVLAGRERTAWYGPAIGLGTLITVLTVAIRLPGKATAVAVLAVLLVVASGALLWHQRRREEDRPHRIAREPVVVVVLATLLASLPFIASHRLGLLGMSLNNDLATHQVWTDSLRDPSVVGWAAVVPGYPLGPHYVVLALAELGGLRIDHAFQALLLAIMPMMALAAGAFAEAAPLWRRTAVALAGGFAYMASAYYGQGSFKEPMLALALLAGVAYVRDLGRAGPAGALGTLRAALPIVLLLAGAVYTFSHIAAAWFGGFVLLWGAGMAALHPWTVRRALGREHLARNAKVVGGALLLVGVIVLPQIDQLRAFIHQFGTDPSGTAIPVSSLGNLVRRLSGYETFGIWFNHDFRFLPPNTFATGAWVAVAVAAAGLGLLIALERRDLALPSAAVACLAVYWWSNQTQSPYVTAKAQVIAAPVLVTMAAAGLVGYPRGTSWNPLTALRLGFGLVVIAAALYSSTLALRFSPVAHDSDALHAFAATAGERPVLFLGHDDFVSAEMAGAQTANISEEGQVRALPVSRSEKVTHFGDPIDWDAISGGALDDFDYVVVPDGRDRSEAPANFALVRNAGGYDLYKRTGPTEQRSAFDAEGQPGAYLDCHTDFGRKLSHLPGFATVMHPPIVAGGLGAIEPTGHREVSLALPPGRWELSLQYTSPLPLRVSGPGGLHVRLPAYLGRPGPYFRAGRVDSRGSTSPVVVQLAMEKPSWLTSPHATAALGTLAATKAEPRGTVPLRRACGRYVDWYRVAGT